MAWDIKVNDISQTDFVSIQVLDTIAGVKKFDAVFSSAEKETVFNHYEDVKIYGESGNIIFRGRIEEMTPDHTADTTLISGRDYLSELLDKYVIEAYITKLRSYIVNDIVSKNSDLITRTNVQNSPSGTELTYTFKTSVWDVLVQCAREDGYKFWLDTSNDLHYSLKGYTDSGMTLILGTDDILSFNIEERSHDIINRVTIYGGGTPQVIIMLEDTESQIYYNIIKEKRIIDDEVDTETLAIKQAEEYLKEHAWVLEMITFEVDGYETLESSELIHVTIGTHNIDDDYLVISKIHKFPSNITTIQVTKYSKNLESLISDMVDRLSKLEQTFIDESAIMTRIERYYEGIGFADTYKIYQINLNDTFRLGHDGYCNCGKSQLGTRRSVPNLIRSG